MCIYVIPEVHGCTYLLDPSRCRQERWIMQSLISCVDTQNEVLSAELKALRNTFTERNQQEGQQLRVEMENKDFELGHLRVKMVRQENIVQDTALQVEAMEKDKCMMKMRQLVHLYVPA
ncbi:hypothetical protein VaNZ11_010450 [Volvox africanus]|uniref:Uncharacterized protein n=1 Tax=Volvox africanus TaxID=51714 RepID=A0ABQ5SAP0_9CHLO|nr:hypothetical protein VaNZ11_010450 [Volvox africanus]